MGAKNPKKPRKRYLVGGERRLILNLFRYGVSLTLLAAGAGRSKTEIEAVIREAVTPGG
jgi:hypothetical protein